ncbi:hypothetical protein [Bacteriovorax sp. Seq25_V]|uniref:hypothetical protein n=1 Tax=Bacteriovorax sp. Seq25_V TaxID=1201288 RepID=UPI00038A2F3C|nr:hypothetical protein [Bacteriovorax sp. Seq25_V]EQC47996.1 hypothetical protein M900_A0061 [Bacteriovorax sp. Seq25_V]
MKFSAFLSMLFMFNTFALECPSSKSLQEKALDVVEVDLSGARIDGNNGSKCLAQNKFPHALVVFDASNELESNPNFIVDSMKDVKVLEVNVVDKDVEAYVATVEIKAKSTQTGKVQVIKDKYYFSLYTTKDSQKAYGCAGVYQYPENIYLLKSCQSKD